MLNEIGQWAQTYQVVRATFFPDGRLRSVDFVPTLGADDNDPDREERRANVQRALEKLQA